MKVASKKASAIASSNSEETAMRIQPACLLAALLTVFVSGCASDSRTGTERDFGNSVRNMISTQTANPYPPPAGEELGDGPRLEAVLEAYRKDAGSRAAVDGKINIDPVVTGN